MHEIMVPAIAAGGRVAAAALGKKASKRRTSIRLKFTTFENENTTDIELTIRNPEKNRDSVIIESVVLLVQIHDESCNDPTLARIWRPPHSVSPDLPIELSPGEQQKWRGQVHKRDVLTKYRQKTRDALRSQWGEAGLESLEASELRAKEFRRKTSFGAKIARCVQAIENSSPRLVLQVGTKQDGNFKTRPFPLTQSNFWERARHAWAESPR